MSDADLRELERKWRETGSVEDEASWERALLRAGRTDEARLELVEFLRTPLPNRRRFYFFGPNRPLARGEDGAERWVQELASFGHEALLRTAFAGAVDLLPVYLGEAPDGDTHVPELLCAVGRWISSDTTDTHEADRVHAELSASCSSWEWPSTHTSAGPAAFRAILALHPLDQRQSLEGATWSARHVARNWGIANWERPLCDFIRVVRAELVPWALGYSDPVRERVESRQREAARE